LGSAGGVICGVIGGAKITRGYNRERQARLYGPIQWRRSKAQSHSLRRFQRSAQVGPIYLSKLMPQSSLRAAQVSNFAL
jgi:hypothetical protein